MTPRVLITGFEPFGDRAVNPSQLIVEALAGEHDVALLPVAYARAADTLRAALAATQPDVVICFGQADGRSGISIERFAHNLDGAENIDNDGATSAAPIDPDGPVAYASTLPVDEIVAALRAEGIPAADSRDAGGFLCNHVFYALMRALDGSTVRGGFVHVPLLPEQALDTNAPSMPLETLVRAARVIVATCAAHSSGS